MRRYIFVYLLTFPLASIAQQSTFGVLGGATISSYVGSEYFGSADPVAR
ncbi:MAG: hypothetical protein AAF632_25760 [Bacteroidota bacterium]